MREDYGWDIMSGNAIEEKPKAEPRIEVKFHNCDLEVSGLFAKMVHDWGFKRPISTMNPDGTYSISYKLSGYKHDGTTMNPDGTRSIFFKLKG